MTSDAAKSELHPRRRIPWRLIALLLLAIAIVWALYAWQWSRARHRDPPAIVKVTPEQVARGRYLAAAADCAACHTADGGAPFAGGVGLPTPFGTIFGTNITPDPVEGIGQYSAREFHRAVTRGVARDGKRLYPAMPYVSYRSMTREDSDAIYAWLMTRPAVARPNPRNEVAFPFNLRAGLIGWNLLFGRAQPEPASAGASADWQRGRYLVDVLGHCGECHSPRGSLGQIDTGRSLSGNDSLGHFSAPDITPNGLAAHGWTAASLQTYLARGHVAEGVASDEMLKVVRLSTSRLEPADLKAMTTYLLGDAPLAPQPLARLIDAEADSPARDHYLTLCAGCHGRDGQGVPNVAPAMAGNLSLRAANPHNLILTILDGLPIHELPGTGRMQPMPGFSRELTDAEVADLTQWLRRAWGGQDAAVDTTTVTGLRLGR